MRREETDNGDDSNERGGHNQGHQVVCGVALDGKIVANIRVWRFAAIVIPVLYCDNCMYCIVCTVLYCIVHNLYVLYCTATIVYEASAIKRRAHVRG